MTVSVLISGSLFRAPEQKTSSKTDKLYVTGTMKVVAGNESEFWRILAFSETSQAALLRLTDGDKLAVQGALKVELYTGNDGSQKLSRTVMVDGVLALKPAPRQKKDRSTASLQPSRRQDAPEGRPALDDAIPF